MTDMLRILISPVVWLAAFSAIYGLHGMLCEFKYDGPMQGMPWPRFPLVVAFALAFLLQVVLLGGLYSVRFGAAPGFTRTVSRTSGWIGLAATIWTLFPILTVSTCG